MYVDQSGAHPYKLVAPITVPVKEGLQQFEIFGRLEEHLGVVSDPIVAKDRSPGYWLKFRTLTIVNHNKLEGFHAACDAFCDHRTDFPCAAG